MVKGGARSAWRLLARAPEVKWQWPGLPLWVCLEPPLWASVRRTLNTKAYRLRSRAQACRQRGSVTMLPHRARDVLHGRTIDRQQVVAGNEAAKVRRAGRVNAPDDDLPCEPCNRYARAWVYQALIGHAGY